MIDRTIENWTTGLVNEIEPESIPVGSFQDALNFLTFGDRFELRRGSRILGTDAGAGSVGGLEVAANLDSAGTEVIFRKRARKIEYYTEAIGDWTENGSDVIPAAAEDDDFAFATYYSQAGAQVFGSSPNSSHYKIMVANPGSITDLLATVYRGYIRVKQSRTFLWNRKDTSGRRDEHNPYLSYIDNRQYTTVTAEAIGAAGSLTYAGTLAFKAAGSKRTCFGVTFTDGVELFTDNRDGTLTGDQGGTGTINYTSGAYSVTFNAVAGGSVTSTYQWEDSTNQGLADFSFSGTRTAGQGNIFLQGEGGPFMGVESYGPTEYCYHKRKTYALTIPADDTNSTNLIFRDNDGVPNWRACKGTSKGIFYLQDSDQKNPQLKRVVLQEGSTADDDEVISVNLDLSGYRFDRCAIEEWGEYIITWCRTEDSSVNNRAILYNTEWEAFDIVDYWGLASKVFGGALIFGESITGNVVEGFSGVDDSDAVIDGHATINEWDLDYPGYLKVVKEIQIEGNIGPDQVFDVYVALDKGAFVLIGQIRGDGNYVDRNNRVSVGPQTLGRGVVGGGSSSTDGITAYHYNRPIAFRVGRFERVSLRFTRGINADDPDNQIDGIGYFSVSKVRYHDVRLKSQKLPRRFRT